MSQSLDELRRLAAARQVEKDLTSAAEAASSCPAGRRGPRERFGYVLASLAEDAHEVTEDAESDVRSRLAAIEEDECPES